MDDDLVVDDVLRQDEDAAFDHYMATSFRVDANGRPADSTVSHIAAEAGTYAVPPAPVEAPEPYKDPDTHAGVRQTESSEVLEERAVEQYLRLTMPGYTPQP